MVEFTKEFLARLRACDTEAVELLDQVCRPRLIQFVSRRLKTELRRRVEPEDVAQEALTHFMVLLPRRILDFRDSWELWRVLRNIARHKLGRLRKRHFAAKRDVRAEQDVRETEIAQSHEPADQHMRTEESHARVQVAAASRPGIGREIPGGPCGRAARCLLNRGESVSEFFELRLD